MQTHSNTFRVYSACGPARAALRAGLALSLAALSLFTVPEFALKPCQAAADTAGSGVCQPRDMYIGAGYDYTCASKPMGGVMCWGANDVGQLGNGTYEERRAPVSVVGISRRIQSLAVGAFHACALSQIGNQAAAYSQFPMVAAAYSFTLPRCVFLPLAQR